MEWVVGGVVALVLIAWAVTTYANAFSRVESPFAKSDFVREQEALAYAEEQRHLAATTCHVCGAPGKTMVVLATQTYYVVCDGPACEATPEIADVRHLEIARVPVEEL